MAFKIDIPGLPSRLAIWPASAGFCPVKRAAWLDSLSLEHLRELQARIEAYQVAASAKFLREGRGPALDDAVAGMASDEKLVDAAVARRRRPSASRGACGFRG